MGLPGGMVDDGFRSTYDSGEVAPHLPLRADERTAVLR